VKRLDELLAQGVADQVFPMARAEVWLDGTRAWHGGTCPEDTVFDVASLTKVMATGTLAALLSAEGLLDLDAPASRWLPGFAGDKGRVTLRHLLAHTSGLPAWRPLHLAARREPERPADAVEDALAAEPLEAAPGSRTLYSDLGYVALGMALERMAGAPLNRLFDARVAAPLRLDRSFFLPERPIGEAAGHRATHRFVPTVIRETGEERVGRVHDENARALGGVAGHAGLFSSLGDVALFGQTWLDALAGRSPLLPAATAALFAGPDSGGGERGLAWDRPSGDEPAIGSRLGLGRLGAIGHLGFTGCSLWIDRDRALVCALLTNHCPRVGAGEAIRAFRRRFHDAVARALGL
jgi:CubicO group peptidase (beta-lactamase class C family)